VDPITFPRVGFRNILAAQESAKGTTRIEVRFFRRAGTLLAHGFQARDTPAAMTSAAMFLAFIGSIMTWVGKNAR
jgi:hypothetical protein